MSDISIELNKSEYEQLLEIAKTNNTTLETVITNILKLCVKENGLVVWKNGFDKPYTVLRTKEEVSEWMKGVIV